MQITPSVVRRRSSKSADGGDLPDIVSQLIKRGNVVDWDGLESTLFYVLYEQVLARAVRAPWRSLTHGVQASVFVHAAVNLPPNQHTTSHTNSGCSAPQCLHLLHRTQFTPQSRNPCEESWSRLCAEGQRMRRW